MKRLLPILFIIVLFSCKEENKSSNIVLNLTAQQIVDKAIENSCQGNCDQAIIEFTFRDKIYKSSRNNGVYKLERIQQDSVNEIHDVVTNRGLYRFVNKERFVVQDTTALKISDGVNSVHYFAQLPYGLNDAAVQKKILGEDIIENQTYYEIEVTFSEENGGTDFEDRFVYWIHKDNFTVDYLAYQYATSGGGIRFREAYNPRVINGIRFVDYNNYKSQNKEAKLSDLDRMFTDGNLKLLSKIETEDVTVEISN